MASSIEQLQSALGCPNEGSSIVFTPIKWPPARESFNMKYSNYIAVITETLHLCDTPVLQL